MGGFMDFLYLFLLIFFTLVALGLTLGLDALGDKS
jgi:hypothetical protein